MTGGEVPEFVLEWARLSGPAKVLAAARTRLERGRLGQRAVLDVHLSPVERQEVGRMLPAAWTPSGDPVALRQLRDNLATSGTTLEHLLVAVGGPLRDLAAERRQARATAASDRSEALAELRTLLDTPAWGGLEDDLRATLDRRVLRGAPASELAHDIARVMGALPCEGDVPLAALAAALFADAHALDRSRPLGRAMARFLAIRAAVAGDAVAGDAVAGNAVAGGTNEVEAGAADVLTLDVADPVASPDAWRAAWASAGVTCDAVSSQVLVLNLHLVGDAPAVALCDAAPGEPTWLTLRSLSGRFALRTPQDVFVCENPAVVEAAASSYGARARTLVCTYGRPTAATWTLLRGLGSDARLHVRADGDATGWSIVRTFLAEFPQAEVWRMPEGMTAFEEELLDSLLADLADTGA